MDYADEPYRRLYTRRTATNKLLGWEGRAVMHEMYYELDRAGVFDFPGDDPVDSVTVATGLPVKAVRIGLERLFRTKTWVLRGSAIIWPNFVEAQNCPHSDRLRQQESRKRRLEDKLNPAQKGGLSQNVTNGHEMSQPVTDVTFGHSQNSIPQNRPTQFSSDQPNPERGRKRPKKPTAAGANTLPSTWMSYPPGWHWNAETEAAASIVAVTAAELQDEVDYWTTHIFTRPVRDLDGELRRSLGKIHLHAEKVRAKAAQAVRSTHGARSPDDRLQRQADRIVMLRREEAANDARQGAPQ